MPEENVADNAAEVARKIDRHIVPWKWALGLAIYFPFAQLLAVLGSANPDAPEGVVWIFVVQALSGALLGALAAFAARAVVKAVRC